MNRLKDKSLSDSSAEDNMKEERRIGEKKSSDIIYIYIYIYITSNRFRDITKT